MQVDFGGDGPQGKRPGGDKTAILQRLARIEGQVRGLRLMVEQDRETSEQVQQMNAAVAALREVALLSISQEVRGRLHAMAGGPQDTADVQGLVDLLRALRVSHPAEPGRVDDAVVLDFDDRYRRRMALTGTRGLAFMLDLPQAAMLRGGDVLDLEDGRCVEVVAAPEPLVEVRSATPEGLARLAWHLGNRHLPVEVRARSLRLRRDHVIEAMLQGLGARLVLIEAPFDPEGGAYAAGGDEPHGHHHGHAHHGHAHRP
jgi:urease accessory protein